MMKRLRRIFGSERGGSFVEFALIAPAFCTLIVAIGNLGTLFFAHSGISAAVSEGARLASTHPRPSDTDIIARINDRKYALNAADVVGPTITPGALAGGRSFLDIEMSYTVRLNFIFFNWSTSSITERRRVFVYT